MTTPVLQIDLSALPPLSPLSRRLIGLDWEADNAERELLMIVGSEPVLSARLVGLANSVAFGVPGGHISSVLGAIRRIGLRRTTQLATATLFGQALGLDRHPKTARALWLHALAVAFAAQEIARMKKLPGSDTAYLLGLFHDLGYMLMEYCHPGALETMVDMATQDGMTQDDAEFKLFGAGHAELAASLLARWEVPPELVEPIRIHHSPTVGPDSQAAVIFGAETVARSSDVAERLYAGLGHPFAPLAADRASLELVFDEQLDFPDDAFGRLVDTVTASVDGLREIGESLSPIAAAA
jgi:putative nucleotidyltransferase with HDIG domain